MAQRVVLLHGLACSRRAYGRLVPLLEAAGNEVVALDLPGHGEDADGPGAESIEEMAGAVRDQVSETAVFVGHSMGGHVALAVAEQDPSLVQGLVLVNSAPTKASRLTASGGAERALRMPGIGPLLWKTVDDQRARGGLATAFAPGTEVPDVFVADLRRLSWQTFARATSAVDDYLQDTPIDARLGRLDVPTAVVFGERDLRVDVASLDRYASTRAVVTRIPESGHSPIWETPDQVAALLG